MSDNPQDYSTASAADFRARIQDHLADRATAAQQHAAMAGTRRAALVSLTIGEMLEFDTELARKAIAVERADAHLDLLRPALAAAEKREADAQARQRAAEERLTFGEVSKAAIEAFSRDPDRAKSVAQVTLTARGPVVSEYNPAVFDPRPAPIVTRVDEGAWLKAREAQLAAEAGGPITQADFGRHAPGAAATLLR